MEQRTLGRTGRDVSVVGLGTWQLGADWGEVSEADALAVLEASAEAGRHLLRHRRRVRRRPQRADHRPLRRGPSRRRLHRRHQDGPPRWTQVPENYIAGELPGLDRPVPHQPRRRPARPGAAALPAERGDRRRRDVRRPGRPGRRRARSRRTASASRPVDQALTAIARPHVASVQIILNAFRLKPLDAGAAGGCRGGRRDHRAGAARLGPAVGQVRRATRPSRADDHRTYNRDGSAFDVGRDLLRRGLRDRRRGGAGVRRAGATTSGPTGLTPGAGRLAWVVAAARGHHGDPGRPQRRARRAPTPRPATADRCRAEFLDGVPRHLRPARPRRGPRPLVTRC